MTLEIIIIGALSILLVAAIIWILWRKPSGVLPTGLDPQMMDLLVGSIQKIQGEQKTAQEIQRSLKDELRQTSDKLKDLVVSSQERQERDGAYFQNLLTVSKSIESVMRGSKTKGLAGENIVREILKLFPQNMMVYDFKLGSKVVEFGIKLPDGRILPLDSKVVSPDEILQLQDAQDEATKIRLVAKLEQAVLRKAKEVSGYISPPITYERAIMAVPDALFDILQEVIIRAHRDYGVTILPYSMTVQYILLFLDLQRKHATTINEDRIKSFLEDIGLSLSKIDDILDNKIAKGNVMIGNAYSESKQLLSQLRGEAVSLSSGVHAAKLGEANDEDPI